MSTLVETQAPSLQELMSIAQHQERPIGAKAAKTATQNQALLNANLSRNSKFTLQLAKVIDARTKVMENSQGDALFGQLEDGHPEKEAYFKRRRENFLLMLDIQTKRLKAVQDSIVDKEKESNPSTIQGPSMVGTREGVEEGEEAEVNIAEEEQSLNVLVQYENIWGLKYE
jgi:hypothetical protein